MGLFSAPKAPQLPPPPAPPPAPVIQEPEEVQADAETLAKEEQERLRRGRVKTVLTSGQGLEDDEEGQQQKRRTTVLGG